MANTKVQSEQIEDGAITAAKIADGAIVASEVADNAITTAKINADAVTGAKIADNAIDSEHYTDGSIDTAHIADDQVTQAKMANDSVGADELASSAVVTASIVDDAVTSAKIDTNIDIAGTFDVTGATTLDSTLAVAGDLTASSDIIIDNSSGDPFLKLKTSAQEYVIRIDQSDSEKFQIRDVTDSATRITLDGSGNVGIGTASPAQKLEVAGRIRATTDPTFEAYEASGKRGGIQWDATNDFLKMFSVGGDIVFESQNNSGNVGIGETSPTAPLHVTRTASGYPILKLTQNGADQYNTIYLQNSNSTAATVVMGTGGGSVGNAAWANNAVFGTTSNANVVILQNDAEKLRVNSVADDATLKITQSSETGGQLLIRSNYSDPHYLATQGTNHSSGGWYWGYGVQMQGNGTTKSTFSNFSGSRSFVQLFGDRIQYNFAGAQNTTIGNAVSLTESVRIDAQGIKFNGDTATANALDDYEEGAWTPNLNGATGASIQDAHYVKIGAFVYLNCYFTFSGLPNDSQVFKISGLPYATQAGATYGGGSISYAHSANVADMTPLTASGNSYIYFHELDGNSATVTRATAYGRFGSSGYILLNMHYMTAF